MVWRAGKPECCEDCLSESRIRQAIQPSRWRRMARWMFTPLYTPMPPWAWWLCGVGLGMGIGTLASKL